MQSLVSAVFGSSRKACTYGTWVTFGIGVCGSGEPRTFSRSLHTRIKLFCGMCVVREKTVEKEEKQGGKLFLCFFPEHWCHRQYVELYNHHYLLANKSLHCFRESLLLSASYIQHTLLPVYLLTQYSVSVGDDNVANLVAKWLLRTSWPKIVSAYFANDKGSLGPRPFAGEKDDGGGKKGGVVGRLRQQLSAHARARAALNFSPSLICLQSHPSPSSPLRLAWRFSLCDFLDGASFLLHLLKVASTLVKKVWGGCTKRGKKETHTAGGILLEVSLKM